MTVTNLLRVIGIRGHEIKLLSYLGKTVVNVYFTFIGYLLPSLSTFC